MRKKDWVIVALMIYGIVSFIAGSWGAADAVVRQECSQPKRRIIYVLPAYYVGCWLFVDLGKKEVNKEKR